MERASSITQLSNIYTETKHIHLKDLRTITTESFVHFGFLLHLIIIFSIVI